MYISFGSHVTEMISIQFTCFGNGNLYVTRTSSIMNYLQKSRDGSIHNNDPGTSTIVDPLFEYSAAACRSTLHTHAEHFISIA